MKHLKRYLPALLFCLLLLLVCTATGYAENVYIMKETELTQLEANLQTLSELDSASKQELQTLKTQLTVSAQQSEKLNLQLIELKELNATQEKSLSAANKYLEEYAAEVRRQQKRIKRQRNFAWILTGCILIYAVGK